MKLLDQNNTQTLFEFNNQDKAVTKLETKTKVIWIEHEIPNKKGNIRHFLGSSDGDVVLSGKLLGTQSAKASNKGTIRSLALNGTILYLDTEGYENEWKQHLEAMFGKDSSEEHCLFDESKPIGKRIK